MYSILGKDRVEFSPLVSIITISYNPGRFIEETIKSVLGQSYRNIEYIIIDGGSTDGTIDIIRKYECCNIKWISEPDQGISDAFNKGINIANGEIIGLINADDWLEKDAIENIINNFQDNKTIICGRVRLWKNMKSFKEKQSSLKCLKSRMTIWHPGMFCTKKIYEEIGLYDKQMKVLMDYDFVIRCLSNDVQFYFIDKVTSNMRAGGISNKLIYLSMKEALMIKNKYLGHKLKHKIEFLYYYLYYNLIIKLKDLIYGGKKF